MRRRSSATRDESRVSGFSCSGGALKTGRFHCTSARETMQTSAGGSAVGGGRKLGRGKCISIQVQVVTIGTENCAVSFPETRHFPNQAGPVFFPREITVLRGRRFLVALRVSAGTSVLSTSLRSRAGPQEIRIASRHHENRPLRRARAVVEPTAFSGSQPPPMEKNNRLF